jgi:UDP-N-acetylmuramoyl-tripeptide--D-alanyl-D-alanine ligase
MIPLTLDEIAAVVGGSVADDDGSTVVSGHAFHDSREVAPDGLFVAVPGERVDGHHFAADTVAAGGAACLTTRPVGVPAVVVPDPVVALQRLAAHVLGRLPDLVVIGITGSQGKTSTKDIVAQLLERHGETIATVGSFNNELGAPLTALQAGASTRYLVSELGARGRGHIRELADMVRPRVGLVLNVGVAHLGEFGSREDIAVAKGELVEALPGHGTAVLNADDPLVAPMRERTVASVRTFGEGAAADVRYSGVGLDPDGHVTLTLHCGAEQATLTIPLVGEHQAGNAAAAAAVALAVGMPFQAVVAALTAVRPRSRWRMEVRRTASGVTVINDAYNANPDSMRAALKALVGIAHRQGSGARTFAVLGEMKELGDASREEHDAIGRLAVRLDVSQLIVVGEEARPMHLGASLEGSWDNESVCVPDPAAALALLEGALREGDVVLVKASRAAGLERVALGLLDDAGPHDESDGGA